MTENFINEKQVTIDIQEFIEYKRKIIHQWSRTLAALGFTLVPLFFILDFFTLPQELLVRFAIYRAVATIISLLQFIIVSKTKPNILSYLHGYVFSIIVGGVIVLMTGDLSGFDARYYAGLNLVIIAVITLLPLGVINAAINGMMIIAFYVAWNLFIGKPYSAPNLISNLFFMHATVIISVSVNYVRYRHIQKEFYLRSQLQDARDALWSEMELAKKIQTSLLPDQDRIGNYEIAGIMLPAEEVGGDYYDIVETRSGERWIAIGDVSGHGLESGLVMMMAQISFFSMINIRPGNTPSSILEYVNYVIRKNLKRLDSNRYMTMMALRLDESGITVSGSHQDILIYRTRSKIIEKFPIKGSWIGLADNLGEYLTDFSISVNDGDLMLLFTDGVTEAGGKDGEMFGQERLEKLLYRYADLPVNDIVKRISNDVISYHEEQYDDITLLALRKLS